MNEKGNYTKIVEDEEMTKKAQPLTSLKYKGKEIVSVAGAIMKPNSSEGVAPEPDYSRHNPRIELRKVCEQEAHDATIRQDEREKVLEEIMVWLCDCDGGDVVYNPKLGLFSSPGNFNTVGLIYKIKSLRQPKQKKEVPE
jgi:hypothetical protein